MRRFLSHSWRSTKHMIDQASGYVVCFGAARGSLTYFASKLIPGLAERTVRLTVPGSSLKLLVRLGGSDVGVFNDTFHVEEHDWGFAKDPAVIVDVGAYTGLSTAYFAMRFPNARIIALEPSKANFALLAQNTSSFKNVEIINAALWSESSELQVMDPGWGAWGYFVGETGNRPGSRAIDGVTIPAISIPDLMREYGLANIDFLKIDIEGGEKEVLSNSGPWIKNVEAIAVELHDRFMPGCTRAFYTATLDFPFELNRGEKILAVREGSELIRRPVNAGAEAR